MSAETSWGILEGERRGGFGRLLGLLLPAALLLAAVGGLLLWDPAGVFQQRGPPVEEITFQRVTVGDEGIRATVVNSGPSETTISQVLVDDAYWEHRTTDGEVSPTLDRWESTTLVIPYPWVEGEDHAVVLITATGITFEHTITAATPAPTLGVGTLGIFALVGILVGVLPIYLGMTWYPGLRRLDARWYHAFLAFTLGLLAFLLVDTATEALELGEQIALVEGAPLVAFGASAVLLAVLAMDHLREQARSGTHRIPTPLWVAGLVAVGIGLHNLGEGLAIGSAYALGETGLGAFLILGFTLHNLTEGPAILAPGKDAIKLRHALVLGAIGGVPTILGAWIGGFAFSPLWGALFLAMAAGAITVVLLEVGIVLRKDTGGHLVTPHTAFGFLLGFLVMLLTGMMIAL